MVADRDNITWEYTEKFPVDCPWHGFYDTDNPPFMTCTCASFEELM